MIGKLEDIGAASIVLMNMFDTIKDEVRNYDGAFNDAYVSGIWVPAIDLVLGMKPTSGLIKKHKDVTVDRNRFMFGLKPILMDLEYKLKSCIKAGTITNALGSFGLSALRNGIRKKDFDAFHLAYVWMIGQVNAHSEALIAVGFTADKIANITVLHDKAQSKQQINMGLESEIHVLSKGNQVVINACLLEDRKVMAVIKAYANSINDRDLERKATWKALLKHVRNTQAKKPRNRKLKAGGSMVVRSRMDAKNLLQMTLLTDVRVIVYRTKLKSEVRTEGTELPFNALWEGKQEALAGTGRFVKMTNLNTERDGVVRFYELEVHSS